jgi:hypothetical protein
VSNGFANTQPSDIGDGLNLSHGRLLPLYEVGLERGVSRNIPACAYVILAWALYLCQDLGYWASFIRKDVGNYYLKGNTRGDLRRYKTLYYSDFTHFARQGVLNKEWSHIYSFSNKGIEILAEAFGLTK